jgi:hypothetical protein
MLDYCSRYVLKWLMSRARRYPPPWKIEEADESYVVTDAKGQRLAFIYFEDEPQRRMVMRRISRDDAWQLARAITRIPALLERN